MEAGRTFLALLMMGLGIMGALFPHIAWHIPDGWRSHGQPPSHTRILVNRVGGTIFFLAGLWVLLVR